MSLSRALAHSLTKQPSENRKKAATCAIKGDVAKRLVMLLIANMFIIRIYILADTISCAREKELRHHHADQMAL